MIDATAQLQPYWNEIRITYIEPVLTYSDRLAQTRQAMHEYAVILVRTEDHQLSDQVLECTSWTTATSDVRSVFDAVQFYGGGFGPVAMGAALQQVVYLQGLPSLLPQAQQAIGDAESAGQPPYLPCHCVLVSASPPDRRLVCIPGLVNPSPLKATMPFHHHPTNLLRLLPRERCVQITLLLVMQPSYALDSTTWVSSASGQLAHDLLGSEQQRLTSAMLHSNNYAVVRKEGLLLVDRLSFLAPAPLRSWDAHRQLPCGLTPHAHAMWPLQKALGRAHHIWYLITDWEFGKAIAKLQQQSA